MGRKAKFDDPEHPKRRKSRKDKRQGDPKFPTLQKDNAKGTHIYLYYKVYFFLPHAYITYVHYVNRLIFYCTLCLKERHLATGRNKELQNG